MVSLLSRLSGSGRDDGSSRALPVVWLGLAAVLAVDLAGLAGLGLAIVVVQTLDPTGGLSLAGSAALAGQLWLLAQGGELELRSGPLVLAPLLLTLSIAWSLSRAGRGVVRAGEVTAAGPAVRAGGVLVAAHLLLAVGVAFAVDAGTGRIGLLPTAAGVAVVAGASVSWGVARECGLLDTVLDRLPGPARPVLRGVLAGLLTALALCAAVVAAALASDVRGYAAMSGSLGGSGAGAAGSLGLALLYLPNAVAAVLGLAAGPGFLVGSGTSISVSGVTLGAVPALPLLAALPDTQAVPLIAFVSQAVPALAGLVAGTTVGRWFSERDGGSVVAGLTGVLAGVLLGVVCGALVAVAGGSLGDGALADVGAPPVATGLAMAAQCGIAAALAAAITRWRALR